MQSKLEDLLKGKERELKLYQRFVDLKTYCENSLFPSLNVPLKSHVDNLKLIIERLLPDPRDRTEEMFSGEIFTLLGIIYLHDVEAIKNYELSTNRVILNDFDDSSKALFVNYQIAKNLDIPEMAIEIINYLTFSDIVKQIPIEWEITEDSKRAIIRNTRLIGHIFNFSHLLLDCFYSGIQHPCLKRSAASHFPLRPEDMTVHINSREGLIKISCTARYPYDLHLYDKVRAVVDASFVEFKNNVNGRLGFQYREIQWDVVVDYECTGDRIEMPKLTPYDEHQSPPFARWDEASSVLDKLFEYRHSLVLGGVSTGKTTVIKAFIVPQLLNISKNVYYSEIWRKPVDEMRDTIFRKKMMKNYPVGDILSLCKALTVDGPCFLIFDNCERLSMIESVDREKLERFVRFCADRKDMYLVIAGDKESFFDWYGSFTRLDMAAIHEVKPIDASRVIEFFGEGRVMTDAEEFKTTMEMELLKAYRSFDELFEKMAAEAKDRNTLRAILAAFLEKDEAYLRRYSIDDIHFRTSLSQEVIAQYLSLLTSYDIIKGSEFVGVNYYSLSSRYLREHLFRYFDLEDFNEKKEIRSNVQNAVINETVIDAETMTKIKKWEHGISFNREEIGIVLASCIYHDRGWNDMFLKAERDGRGVDIQPVLKLLSLEDAGKRLESIKLLMSIRDKEMINPLLAHLKKERDPEIRLAIVTGVSEIGGKKSIMAVMKSLKESGDSDLRLTAVDCCVNISEKSITELLIEIRNSEEDTRILQKIDLFLANSTGTA